MEFCFSGTFSPTEDLVALAQAGDQHGWSTMTISDHIINPVATRDPYPYTEDGSRRWEMGTPWPDPWITVAHLAAISHDYYARLEQGRIAPSPAVLTTPSAMSCASTVNSAPISTNTPANPSRTGERPH